MTTIQDRALVSAVKTLDAIGCKYRIVKPDGDEIVTLPVDPAKPKRQKLHDLKYGSLTPACQKMIGDMHPGEYRRVDLKDFEYPHIPASVFANAISSTAYKLWGKGRFETRVETERRPETVVGVRRLRDDE